MSLSIPPTPLTLAISKLLYPLPELPREKNPKKPLKVLCLGLPRSATDSLRQALEILGYDKVTHGFEWYAENIAISPLYAELLYLRRSRNLPPPQVPREKYFDRILSDYEATTDIPPAWLAIELLQAYPEPEVKVILNRRKDVAAWKRSFRESVLPMMQSWEYWLWSWFNAAMFWGCWITYQGHTVELFGGDFEKNAESAYVGHYERLEKELRRQGRAYLEWSAEEGWEPLCKFLGKPVPKVPFPKGNLAEEFGPRLMNTDGERIKLAKANAVKFGLAVFAVLVGLAALNSMWR